MRHHHTTQSCSGFTLLEFMITVAIITILLMLAFPSYNNYTIRSKVAECISGAAVAKLAISEYRQTLGAWPTNLAEAGLNTVNASKYCSGIHYVDPSSGTFTVDVNETAVRTGLGNRSCDDTHCHC